MNLINKIRIGLTYSAPLGFDIQALFWDVRASVCLQGPFKAFHLRVASRVRKGPPEVLSLDAGRTSVPDVKRLYGSPWVLSVSGNHADGKFFHHRWPNGERSETVLRNKVGN